MTIKTFYSNSWYKVKNNGRTVTMICLSLLAFAVFTFADTPVLKISKKLLSDVKKYYGTPAVKRLLAWQELVEHNKNIAIMKKLDMVNQFFNQIPNLSDMDHWGEKNYWATPLELMASNGGDCEDFAIAKYFTLLALGVPDSSLRITYVTAYQKTDESISMLPHMVLTYYSNPDAEPIILDNLSEFILPASSRPDLKPKYSFNGEGLWRSKRRGQGKLIGRSEMINPWQDMRERMKYESRSSN